MKTSFRIASPARIHRQSVNLLETLMKLAVAFDTLMDSVKEIGYGDRVEVDAYNADSSRRNGDPDSVEIRLIFEVHDGGRPGIVYSYDKACKVQAFFYLNEKTGKVIADNQAWGGNERWKHFEGTVDEVLVPFLESVLKQLEKPFETKA
jgi:hypothetical protein